MTPIVAVTLGIIGFRIQTRQRRIQPGKDSKTAGRTHHQQYRLALFAKRMRVYDATKKLLVIIERDADIKKSAIWEFWYESRDHTLLFGQEIHDYLDEIRQRGMRMTVSPDGFRDPEKQQNHMNESSLQWFFQQRQEVENLFLPYMDFRKPENRL